MHLPKLNKHMNKILKHIPTTTPEIDITFNSHATTIEQVLIQAPIFGLVVTNVIAFTTHYHKIEHAGILTGRHIGEITIPTNVYPAKKIKANAIGFTIPEQELIRIDEERRRDNQPGFIGLYHIHPGYGAFLSPRDIRATESFIAFYGKAINLVVSTNKNGLEYKFFTVENGRAREIPHRFLLG